MKEAIYMFKEWAREQEVILIDGSMSQGLMERDANLNHRLWTAKALIDSPEKIQAVHQSYFDAGSNIAITASYQASYKGFEELNYSEQEATDFLRSSVLLAQEAKKASSGSQEKWIAGSIGPYGAYLADGSEYRGNYAISKDELIKFHKKRIQVLVEAGVDLLAIETMPDIEEIKVLLELLKEFPKTIAWVSCTLSDSQYISDGTLLLDVQSLLEKNPQIIAYGINCVAPELVTPTINILKPAATKELVVYPNSGEHYDPETKTWSHEHTDNSVFTTQAREWAELGCTWIGGCCCTTEKDILALKKTFQK